MSRYCPLPFMSIEADPMGRCKVCCLNTDHIPNIDLRGNTLTEAFDSAHMQDLRQQFIDGKEPSSCRRCWDEEAAGRVSKRINSIKKFASAGPGREHARISFLDLKLGNICNLKCRICGSYSSSKWAGEELAINPNNAQARENLKRGGWPRTSPRFWEDLQGMLGDLRHMEITGGEPFLIDEHFDLLAMAVQQDVARNIAIHYNTNLTTLPQRGLELWPHFREVEIAVSIDDLGPRFEYQRHGADWLACLANLDRLKELRSRSSNITLQICHTTNAQNVYYLPEMCEWISQQGFNYVYFNVLHDPWYFSIRRLPWRAKHAIMARLIDYQGPHHDEVHRLARFMSQGEDSDGQQLVRMLRTSDAIRAQKFSDHHGEVAEIIGYGD